jgi:hypothetical protein
MPPKLVVLPFLLVLLMSVHGQTPPKDKAGEEDEKLEKAAVELLRETSAEVTRLRTMENRISFDSELASLMWFHDDKEARAMYGGVVSDFKRLLAQLDAEMNAPVSPDDDETSGGFGFFGGYGKSKAERKLRVAMEVRKQIAMSLAEHAPDLAFNFFYDSLNQISNPEFRKSQEQNDKYFESELIKQIAASDAAKGLEYGKESLKKSLDTNHVELLKKIYENDQDKGIEFGAAILSKLKTDEAAKKNLFFLSTLLSFGDKNLDEAKKTSGKKPVYERADLRDIAELLADRVMQNDESEYYYGLQSVNVIEKYSPGRAAQIRAKFRSASTASNSVNIMSTDGNIANVSTSGYASGSASNANVSNREAIQRADEERANREKAEKKLMDDIKDLGSKPLPKEERDKVVAQTRKIIFQTRGKDKKIVALSMLAGQVAHAGDKDLANEIMGDAERLINPQPKNYQDFLLSWMLASGYAEANPDKAFPLLENTILRANDTISAFIKVGEFIDVNDEMIDDGEVQVGMFGGSMMREVTGELGIANATILSLARADFAKTVNLTNTFDRTEIRVLAKMMVLRAVLDKRTKSSDIDKMSTDGTEETDSTIPPTPPGP